MKSRGYAAIVLAALGVLCSGSAHAQAEPLFGTRAAVACGAPVKSQPNTKQIEALIRCNTEQKTNDRITLVEDIKIEAGGLRAYNQFNDGYATGIDTDAKVMPIRGSLTRYQCNQLSKFSKVRTRYDVDNTNKNCLVVKQPKAEGKCYKTTFGDWWCNMQQLVATEDYLMDQPPPK